jgi:hypothetical protein
MRIAWENIFMTFQNPLWTVQAISLILMFLTTPFAFLWIVDSTGIFKRLHGFNKCATIVFLVSTIIVLGVC